MPNPNAFALSGKITLARPMLADPSWWMKPRPLGSVYYDTQLHADLAHARREVRFFTKQARKTIQSIRERREAFDAGRYDHHPMVEIYAMFDGFYEDVRFYLGRRRTWLSHQLKLEHERMAQAHVEAAE